MNSVLFQMTAFTDAAGKYTPGAYLNGNEDNFFVCADLSGKVVSRPSETMNLSCYGALMVVADGMGGMNAGEVASDIAIKTVAEYFAADRLSEQLAATHATRMQYLETVIMEADKRIKKHAAKHSECEGMGSTIILAWLVGTELSISWCGDSRAYRYNPQIGIQPLSKDHSYVQDLVDKGIITYEDSFEHPQGNIITRSLGDTNNKVIPESRLFNVFKDDIILLCSDGLSGVLRDCPIKDESCAASASNDTIEGIISQHTDNLVECREQLFAAAERNDWYDNVTAILCRIVEGPVMHVPFKTTTSTTVSATTIDAAVSAPVNATPIPNSVETSVIGDVSATNSDNLKKGSLHIHIGSGAAKLFVFLIIVLIGIFVSAGFWFYRTTKISETPVATRDTVIIKDTVKTVISVDEEGVDNEHDVRKKLEKATKNLIKENNNNDSKNGKENTTESPSQTGSGGIKLVPVPADSPENEILPSI